MFPIKRLIIHHGGTKAKWWQLSLFWRRNNLKPYYHYLIDYDGKIIKGLQDFERGAHIANMNTGSLGICLLGDYTKEYPSDIMIESLNALISFLIELYDIKEIAPHNRYNDTICPGESITDYANRWDDMLKKINKGDKENEKNNTKSSFCISLN